MRLSFIGSTTEMPGKRISDGASKQPMIGTVVSRQEMTDRPRAGRASMDNDVIRVSTELKTLV